MATNIAELIKKSELDQCPSMSDSSPHNASDKEEIFEKGKDGVTQHFDPLFMESLPCNFSSNPKLAAIASLLDDDGYAEEDGVGGASVKRSQEISNKTTTCNSGGGKVKRAGRKYINSTAPYLKPEKITEVKRTSVGEAQLFLKMWKI
jgi:hypothetical protein